MDQNTTIDKRIAQGQLAWEQEAYEEALEIFRGVLEENPKLPDIQNKVGLSRAMLGDLEGALESLDRAVEIAPTYAEAHANRGIVLTELGRHDEAQAAFDESVQLDHRDGSAYPSHMGNQIALAHAHLGDLYVTAGQHEEAVGQFRKALRVRSRFSDIRVKLGEALLETGQPAEAKKEFELVLEADPDFWAARLRLGVALHRTGDDESAVREWRRAAEERPEDLRPRAYLASVGQG